MKFLTWLPLSLLLMALLPQSACAGATDNEGTADARIAAAAAANRYPLAFDGKVFSGPGWQRLVSEGRRAQFFLIGEEHGIAENPQLVSQLFSALAPAGYRRLVIEISPPMAAVVDDALLSGGLQGLHKLFAEAGGEPAFFGMTEEAEMLADIRTMVPPDQPAFWGADYEVAADRKLLRVLEAIDKPAAAQTALDDLVTASVEGWARHAETGSPGYIFTFSGDAGLVRALRNAWPDHNDTAASILDTLEETLEINKLWSQGQQYESNLRRAGFLRDNFLRYWQAELAESESPRVMLKFGANHMLRGRNVTMTFDLGSLLPELAALENANAFSVMVIPGADSPTAVLDAASWSYKTAAPKDGYRSGLDALLSAVLADTFTLIDLRPLRPLTAAHRRNLDDALTRAVFGFDMLLVLSGSTAAGELEHE